MTNLEKLLSIKAIFVDEYKEYILTDGSKILMNGLGIGCHAMINDDLKGRTDLKSGIYDLMGNVQIKVGDKGRVVSMMVDDIKVRPIKRSDKIQSFLASVKAGKIG